jgi:hypothetical protein
MPGLVRTGGVAKVQSVCVAVIPMPAGLWSG